MSLIFLPRKQINAILDISILLGKLSVIEFDDFVELNSHFLRERNPCGEIPLEVAK